MVSSDFYSGKSPVASEGKEWSKLEKEVVHTVGKRKLWFLNGKGKDGRLKGNCAVGCLRFDSKRGRFFVYHPLQSIYLQTLVLRLPWLSYIHSYQGHVQVSV